MDREGTVIPCFMWLGRERIAVACFMKEYLLLYNFGTILVNEILDRIAQRSGIELMGRRDIRCVLISREALNSIDIDQGFL